MGKGDQKERDFVNDWQSRGEKYDAMRAGASGGGTTSDLPDVFYTVNGHRFAEEQKYAGQGQDRTDGITFEEQEALLNFAWKWEAHPHFVFRFANDTTWYVMEPFSDLYYSELTKSGYIYGKRSMTDEYMTLDEYLDRFLKGDE